MQENNKQNSELLNRVLGCNLMELGQLLKSFKKEEAAFLYRDLVVFIDKQPGHAEALHLLGTLYRDGIGTEKDDGKATELYKQAIEICDQAIARGDAKAIFSRAYMHHKGKGGPFNYPAAIKLYEQAIALDDTNAMLMRAIMHRFGRGGPQNYPAAIELYEKAIALGDARAIEPRAYMHLRGEGGPVDYRAAIALGSAEPLQEYAFKLCYGDGCPINYPLAIELYERAIALGNIDAINGRASMHRYGLGGPINYPAAIELFEKAIALGDAYAMSERASMHASGQGEPGGERNLFAAAKLYLKAHKAGYVLAMARLGDLRRDPILLTHDNIMREIMYVYTLAHLNHTNEPDYHYQYLVLLADDASLTQDEKLDYFFSLYPNQDTMLSSLHDPDKIKAFGELQTMIAERTSYHGADNAEQLSVVQKAFDLADAAIDKLAKISGAQAQQLHDTLRERLILARSSVTSASAQTDAESFVNTIQELRLIPNSHRANVLLMELIQVMTLKPYFSAREKRLLLITLASNADPLGQDDTVQTFITPFSSDNLRYISYHQLVSYAIDIINTSEHNDQESIKTLRVLIEKTEHYDPEIETQLLRHPLIFKVLKGPATTYEQVLIQEFHSQNFLPLSTIQKELLSRLDDLALYFDIYPERFPSPLEDIVPEANSLRFFPAKEAGDNAKNETVGEFTEFRKQHRILQAIDNALQSGKPMNEEATDLSKLRKISRQGIDNHTAMNQLKALRETCALPDTTAAETLEKIIDYLSKLDLTQQPINPIINNLLQELSYLLPAGANNNNESVSELRDRICAGLKTYFAQSELDSRTAITPFNPNMQM